MGLERDVEQLVERVEQLEARLAALERSRPRTAVPPPPPPPPPGNRSQPWVWSQQASPPGERHGPAGLSLSSETVLKWAGLTLVVMASAFLLSTAISRGWIGPELQLAGATAAGLGLIAAGFRLVPVNRSWAVALVAGGAVVVPLCAAAASAGLDLVTDEASLVILAAVTAGLAWVAWRLSFEPVASLAATGAAVLPFWVTADRDLPLQLIGLWLAVTAVGFAAYGLVQRWRWCRLTATGLSLVLLGVVALAAGSRSLTATDRGTAYAAVAAVAVVAWFGPALARLPPERAGWADGLDLRTVLPVPLWTWAMVSAIASLERRAPLAVAGLVVAAMFGAAAASLARLLDRRVVVSQLLAASLLVSVSLAVLTGGPALLVALTAQAVAVALLAHRLDDLLLGLQAAALGAIAVIWAAAAMSAALFSPVELGDHLANLAVVVAVIGASLSCRRAALDQRLWRSLAVMGWVGGLGWLATAVIHGPQGQVMVSGLWAAGAVAATAAGVVTARPLSRRLGMATLAVVLGKLLTVDLAEIDTLWRVGLFFVVGTGLLRVGYLLPKLTAARRRE